MSKHETQTQIKTESVITSVSHNATTLNLTAAQEKLRNSSRSKTSCWSCFGYKRGKVSDNIQMILKKDLTRRVRGSIFSKETHLLSTISRSDRGKKTLVLDLDETLVHSSFMPIKNPDFVVPVVIDNHSHNVYVLKRPGVDEFLEALGSIYEIVVFTASLAKYADPVLDVLDSRRVVKHRLFREACVKHKEGNFVKVTSRNNRQDLSLLGRDLKDIIIIDNSPSCYMYHPSNAIPVTSWFNDSNDKELFELIPFLKDLVTVDNVTLILNKND